MTNLSRRSFLGGALSFGAFAGCRAFRAPAGRFSSGKANLVLGVVSDIHVDCGVGDFRKFGDAAQFEKTLRWFDAAGVDGVVVAGDMADNGMINQLQCVAEAWFRVFPGGCSASDGRPVEQLFVYGNHDLEGQRYDQFDFRYFAKEPFAAGQICANPAAAWTALFGERYSPIWMKTVKGYQFVGAHWVKDHWDGTAAVEPWFREHAAEIDRSKPFFFIQHPHPKGTVYGSDAWGADAGYATRALSAFPNAVAFSGHSHTSLTDERSVWQGAFTSIGTSSLRYGGCVDKWGQRQGLLVRVYDDRIVLVRRDFVHDASLGDDWVIPLGPDAPKPYGFETRKAACPAPVFAPGAKLGVKPYAKTVKGTGEAGVQFVRAESGWELEIPAANAGATRGFRYEIDAGVRKRTGEPAVYRVWDAKYNMPRFMAGEPTRFTLKASDLAPGAAPKFTVTALDTFGNRSAPLKP